MANYDGCTSNCGDDPMMPSGCHKEGCKLGPRPPSYGHDNDEVERLRRFMLQRFGDWRTDDWYRTIIAYVRSL